MFPKMDLSDCTSEAAFGLASKFAQDPPPVGRLPAALLPCKEKEEDEEQG